jgi:hypothetical protein
MGGHAMNEVDAGIYFMGRKNRKGCDLFLSI